MPNKPVQKADVSRPDQHMMVNLACDGLICNILLGLSCIENVLLNALVCDQS